MSTDLKALRREMAEDLCGSCDLPQGYAETIDRHLLAYALAVLRAEPSKGMIQGGVNAPTIMVMLDSISATRKLELRVKWQAMADERAKEIS